MARVVMQAVVSVDGYIAYPDDSVGPLFDWYGNGDVELSARSSGWTCNVGGQAVTAGLVDEIAMDVAPVVLGDGVRFFGNHTGTVLLDDPDQVVQGDRVLHLSYTVQR
jgi:hypothetical protein